MKPDASIAEGWVRLILGLSCKQCSILLFSL